MGQKLEDWELGINRIPHTWVGLNESDVKHFQNAHCVFPGTTRKIEEVLKQRNGG